MPTSNAAVTPFWVLYAASRYLARITALIHLNQPQRQRTRLMEVNAANVAIDSRWQVFGGMEEDAMAMNSPQSEWREGGPAEKSHVVRQLDSIAWAGFVIWLGIALLVPVPWGWFLVGVGVLMLAVQGARWQMGMKAEGFWVACGAVFLVGGLWDLLQVPWPLAPILLILFGVALLGKAVIGANR